MGRKDTANIQTGTSVKMEVNTYVVEHDLGFAPNPFYGICTLVACKPIIRDNAKIGDYIVGTSGKKSGAIGDLVYWMRVEDIITFDEYWKDPRFRRKRPCMQGSVMKRYGDNIYHRDPKTSAFLQEDSFHSEENGKLSIGNLKRDTGRTENILFGSEFAYWGGSGPKIPHEFENMIVKGQGHKNKFSDKRRDAFLSWLFTFPERGFIGEPALWSEIII